LLVFSCALIIRALYVSLFVLSFILITRLHTLLLNKFEKKANEIYLTTSALTYVVTSALTYSRYIRAPYSFRAYIRCYCGRLSSGQSLDLSPVSRRCIFV